MALSTVSYTATAAQTDFTVSYPYIVTGHIYVYVDGVLKTITTDYTFPSASIVRFNSGLTGGELVVITRKTSHSTRLVDYESGGSLQEVDLDNDSLQAFYMAQEAIDIAAAALYEDSADAKFDAESKVIKNVADGAAGNDAVNKAQLDAISAAAGNVPTPGNPADDLTVLQANAGAWAWGPVITAAAATVLDDTTTAAMLTTLGAAPAGALNNVVEDTTPQAGGTFSMNAKQMRWAKGADVASAATLTLGTDGNYFDVTGTTAITQIGQLAVGTVVRLHFDGAATLTHHATNLVLPGAANYTTAAGDEFTFVEYAAGDWRCVGYALASGRPLVEVTALTPGTVSSPTSGTTVDYAIPAGANRIMIIFDDLLGSGTDNQLVQLGDAGGVEDTGYDAGSNTGGTDVTSTAGFIMRTPSAAGVDGHMFLTRIAGNDWVASHTARFASAGSCVGGGTKSVSEELTTVRITWTGTNTFVTGSVNVFVE